MIAPVLLFGARGCFADCDLSGWHLLLRWLPTACLATLLVIIVARGGSRWSPLPRLLVLAGTTQLLAAWPSASARTSPHHQHRARARSAWHLLVALGIAGRASRAAMGVLCAGASRCSLWRSRLAVAWVLRATPPQPPGRRSCRGRPGTAQCAADRARHRPRRSPLAVRLPPPDVAESRRVGRRQPRLRSRPGQRHLFAGVARFALHGPAAQPPRCAADTKELARTAPHAQPGGAEFPSPQRRADPGPGPEDARLLDGRHQRQRRLPCTMDRPPARVRCSSRRRLDASTGFFRFRRHSSRRSFRASASPRSSSFQDTWRAPDITEAAIGWLQAVPTPFFLFLNYFDAHAPYDPPGGSPFRGDGVGPRRRRRGLRRRDRVPRRPPGTPVPVHARSRAAGADPRDHHRRPRRVLRRARTRRATCPCSTSPCSTCR